MDVSYRQEHQLYLAHAAAGASVIRRRILAAIIDYALLTLLGILLGQVFGVIHPHGNGNLIGLGGDSLMSIYSSTMPFITDPWLFLIVVLYVTLFESLFGATPGKDLLRLRVVTLDARQPTVFAIAARNLLRLVDAWPFAYIVGALVAWYSPCGQRLGDRAARTLVVPAQPRFAGYRPRWPRQQLGILAAVGVLLAGGCVAFMYFGRPPLVVQSWANLSNSLGATTDAPGSPPLCGTMQPWPFASTPPRGYDVTIPRDIMSYTVGSPRWQGDTITYPMQLELLPGGQTNNGIPESEPIETSQLDGPAIYQATITLRWAGILHGGWIVASGTVACP